MTKTTDQEIIMIIYKRMFKEAIPSTDFDKLIESGESKIPDFFMKYYLSQERQDKILNEALKEFKVPRYKHNAFRTTIILGSSPTGVKKLEEKK